MHKIKFLQLLFILLVTLNVCFAESPNSESTSLMNEAVLAYYQGNIQNSLEKYQKCNNLNSNNCEARLNQIRILRESGKMNNALTEIQNLIKTDPNNPIYTLVLLRIAYLAGDPQIIIEQVNPSESNPEMSFWRGLALVDLKKDVEAIKSLELSLVSQPFNPAANYVLGELYRKNNASEQAQTYYLRALDQEPNFTIALYPLALTYIALEKYQKAYSLLSRTKLISPWNQSITSTLLKLTQDHPELIQQKHDDTIKKRQIAIPPQVISIIEEREKIPDIRIGLAEKVAQFFIKTGDSFILANRDGSESITGISQTILKIETSNGVIQIRTPDGMMIFSSSQPVTISYKNPTATTILFDVDFGGGSFWAGREDRIFRGQIVIRLQKDGLTIINQVNIEEYLYSVVASEMSPIWPAAALNAQAIAARTYAFANMGQYVSHGFDLWGTVISQAYNGVTSETPSTRAAVDNTRGQVLTFNNKPIAAFFTGNSGGYTENSQDIWGFSLPYLQAVADPLLPVRNELLPPENLAEWLSNRPDSYSAQPKYSARSSYRWTLWVPRLELEYRLNLGNHLGSITAIIPVGRGFTGVVKQVLVKGTRGEYLIKSDAIRTKLGGLRSNLFVVEPKLGVDGLPEIFIFNGAGWGNGVGMCQSGAAGMAAAGITTAEILKHYYPGTILEKEF